MRSVPPEIETMIRSGAATLARCWVLQRRDGGRAGFTDHDRPLRLGAVSCEPGSAFSGSALETDLGLSVGGGEIMGALASETLKLAGAEAEAWREARAELWLVNWRDPEQRFLLSAGKIGEIQRNRGFFSAEFRSLTADLNVPSGRVYQRQCDAQLGDRRCGVDLEGPAFRTLATVVEIAHPARFRIGGADSFAPGFFLRGTIRWSGGANGGILSDVRADDRASPGAGRWIQIWTRPPAEVALGDALAIHAGCDKLKATCRTKFANLLNFRGFDQIPGDDAANSYPNTGENLDGGSLNV